MDPYSPQPLSGFIIVATENNTQVEITPTRDLQGGYAAGTPFTITLNRGETFVGLATGTAAANRPAGTLITSDAPIAVTIYDDSAAKNSCRDLIGDQTVPVDILGYEYIVMKGKLNATSNGEPVFIMPVVNNTEIFIDGVSVGTRNAGQAYAIQITNNYMHIRGSNPVYVLHVAGFGCEVGGAVLPTIDGCTGSYEVSFVRSNSQDFFLNLMVRNTKNGVNGFVMEFEDGTTQTIPASKFEAVTGTNWFVLKDAEKKFNSIPLNKVTKIYNTNDVFHIGIINGGPGTGCKYGYFSDYKPLVGNAGVGNIDFGTFDQRCSTSPIRLVAKGGLSYKWTSMSNPANVAYLDDPFIASPLFRPPSDGTFKFEANLTRACYADTIIPVIVDIYPEAKAQFAMDNWKGCSPHTVNFIESSVNAQKFKRWDFDYTPVTDTITRSNFDWKFPDNASDSIQMYRVILTVSSDKGCVDAMERVVAVKPTLKAGFTTSPDTVGCHPLLASYTNTSTGYIDHYLWNFGDGSTTDEADPLHEFDNYGDIDSVYNVSMVAVSPFQCNDTARQQMLIHPYLDVSFTIDTVEKCSPLTVNIRNTSIGGDIYYWDLGDTTFSTSSKDPVQRTYVNTSGTPDTIWIKLRGRNEGGAGCEKTYTKRLIVYPEVTALFQTSLAPQPNVVCDSTQIVFTNQSTGYNLAYEWNFGDGGSSTQEDPARIFMNRTNADQVYNVVLKATSVGNRYCSATYSVPVTVHPYVKADFTLDYSTNCTPFPATINNSSIRGAEFAWDFDGNGTKDSTTYDVLSFTHVYNNSDPANPVTYNIKMTATNAEGCKSSKQRSIEVYPKVVAAFSPDVTEGCTPLAVNFTQQSTGGSLTYSWDFADSTSSASSAGTVPHVFDNRKSSDYVYDVTLTATNPYGCESVVTHPVTAYAYVNADFSAKPAEGCSPFAFAPVNASSGGITSYNWNFGDGNVSSAMSPSHTYVNQTLNDQIRNLRLIVRNSHGCSDTLIRQLSVYPEVVADYSMDMTEGCNPLEVTFTNKSNQPVAASYSWNFDDGSSASDVHPVHVFDNRLSTDHTYNVKLKATSVHGCVADTTFPVKAYAYINAGFSVKSASGCSPKIMNITNDSEGGITAYSWNFDDGSALSASKLPAHTYVNQTLADQTRNLRLIVKNNHNCYDTIIRPITVYPEVVAGFTRDVVEGCNPLQVKFTNTSNFPVANTFHWDFKDGASSSDRDPGHLFENSLPTDKIYPVTMTATSVHGCVHDTTLPVTAWAFIKAGFAVEDADGCSPWDIGLSNASQGGIANYFWDFGDGNTSNAASPKPPAHTYINQTTGKLSHNLQLVVKNTHNCFDTLQQQLTVYPEVQADFQIPSGGCTPLTTTFTNLSAQSDHYTWNFGDGGTSAVAEPSHEFYNYSDVDISRTVTLVATSNYFCSDSVSKSLMVYHRPKALIEVNKLIDCPPFNVSVKNISVTSKSTYFWDMGDGKKDTTYDRSSVSNIYFNPPANPDNKPYTITLLARTDYGCTDQTAQTINVYPEVTTDFDCDTAGCSPYDLKLTNLSTNADNFDWDFGDSQSSKQEHPRHAFFSLDNYNPQQFTIALRSTSDAGCYDQASKKITVYPAPTADFSVSPTLKYFSFDGASFDLFNDTEDGAWKYLWKYDDGNTDSVKNPGSYNYSHWGDYTVSLTVYNAHCSSKVSQPIMVLAPLPVADFDSSYAACAPVQMNFRNNSIWGNVYKWDFDDGTTSDKRDPVHVFDQEGIYNVKLEVDGDGGKNYHYETVTVYKNPVARFEVQPRDVMLPEANVKCFSTSLHADRYLWDFGDGQQSDIGDPEHLYDALGTYDISLKVWTENQCVDSVLLPEAVKVEGAGLLTFPNAFTPNMNGPSDAHYNPSDMNNDVFFPEHDGVKEYHLEIYTRWGELIFTSDDVNIGWNGYYKGQLARQGVYVWKAKGVFYNGKPYNKAGDVTLLHNPKNP